MQYFLLVEVWNSVESLHKMYILSDDPVAVSNTAEHLISKKTVCIIATATRVDK